MISEVPNATGPVMPSSGMPRWSWLRTALLVGFIAVFVLAAYIASHWDRLSDRPVTDDAYVHAEVTPLSAHITGYVRGLHFEDNQSVKAGEILVEIESIDYQATADQAAAAVNSAKSARASIDAQREMQGAVILQAQAELARDQAVALNEDREWARASTLLKSGAASQQRFDAQDAKRSQSKATVTASAARLLAEKKRLGVLVANLAQQDAEIAVRAAAQSFAVTRVNYTRITAPADGIVSQRLVQKGQLVHDGSVVVNFIPTEKIWVVANFKETQLKHVRPGQTVSIDVDALAGPTIMGHVDSIQPGTGATFALLPGDNATGNFTKVVQRVPVKILLNLSPEIKSRLRPGLSVEVSIDDRESGRGPQPSSDADDPRRFP